MSDDEMTTVMAWLFVGLLLRAGWLLLRVLCWVLWWVLRGAWFIAVTLPHRLIGRRRAAHRYRQLLDQLIDEKATRDAAAARYQQPAIDDPDRPAAPGAAVTDDFAAEDFAEWSRELSDGDR